jgi:hypothetical protein
MPEQSEECGAANRLDDDEEATVTNAKIYLGQAMLKS